MVYRAGCDPAPVLAECRLFSRNDCTVSIDAYALNFFRWTARSALSRARRTTSVQQSETLKGQHPVVGAVYLAPRQRAARHIPTSFADHPSRMYDQSPTDIGSPSQAGYGNRPSSPRLFSSSLASFNMLASMSSASSFKPSSNIIPSFENDSVMYSW